MTIAAYTGLPGHGKSYGVVENVIKPALEQKREVFTNIPMNSAECLKRFGMTVIQFNTEDIINNANWWSEVFKPGAVIVIDELWRLWPSGLNAKNVREQDKAFLAEHRHLVGENGQSTEVIFVTQDLSQVANFARSLVETTFRVTKLSKLGMDKRFRVDVYFGAVTGASPPISKRDREIFGTFKKDVYALYQSHTKSLTGEAGNEKRIDNRFNVLGGFGFKLGAVVVVIALVYFYYGFNRLSSYYGLSHSEVKKPNNVQVVPVSTSAPPASPVLKEPVFTFLSKAKTLSFTGHFGTNVNGRMVIDYNFDVYFADGHVSLNDKQLFDLGYKVKIVNECMALVTGADFNGYALCPADEEKSNSFTSSTESVALNQN